MNRMSVTLWAGLAGGAMLLIAGSGPGRAQGAGAPVVELFGGGQIVLEGIKLGGWGSGMAEEDRQQKTIGDSSIRIKTQGFYSGGRIMFNEPRDLTEQKGDPFALLSFTCRFTPGRQTSGTGSGPGGGPFPGRGGEEGAGPGVAGIGGTAFGGAGFPGFGGGVGGVGETLRPETRRLKVMLICEEGSFVASNFPLHLLAAREENWYTVAIPFVAFQGIDRAESITLKEIRIFGDTKDTFWISEIRTSSDDDPISVDSLDDLDVSVGEPVEFTAEATGGISPLAYSWDFDRSDGIQEDATGRSVVHVFRKPSRDVPGRPGELQPYLVTLTVRDLSGAKKPVRREAAVVVNP